ncbi:S1 family peptidase [Actinosynnema sp. CS-041913]|uniref:S1 family peptidase n=1 Tax=Actinosynnema sp. CS-041913 TaxID=3239917 RepID=UPI003D8E541E
MATRRRGALFSLFATLLLLSGGFSAYADSAPPESRLFAANRILHTLADEKGALGVYYDEQRSQFVVVLPATGPGSARTSADFAVDGATPIVRRSSTTQAGIDAVHSRIRAEAQRNKAAGHVFGSAFDFARDVMVVTSDAPQTLVRSLSAGLAIPVEHRHGTGGRNSRQYDPVPFRGGAAITVGTKRCTSGFTVKDPQGDRYLLTVGHCGYVPGVPIGRPVQNTGSGEFMGYFYNWNYPDRDIALIARVEAGYYTRQIYVGDVNGKAIRVAGASDPVVGRSDYCRSGAVSAEKCGHRVVNTNGQFCDAAGCTRNLISYDKGTPTQAGDSGAPFYTYNADRSAVVVHGMHVAISGAMYFAEKWSLIASSQGVSIVTDL